MQDAAGQLSYTQRIMRGSQARRDATPAFIARHYLQRARLAGIYASSNARAAGPDMFIEWVSGNLPSRPLPGQIDSVFASPWPPAEADQQIVEQWDDVGVWAAKLAAQAKSWTSQRWAPEIANNPNLRTLGYGMQEAIRSVVPPLCFLLVCDEWNSHLGGISTFDRLLSRALATCPIRTDVTVYVAENLDETDRQLLADEDIHVRLPDRIAGLDPVDALAFRPPSTPVPDVIIGHGAITGTAAAILQRDHYPNATLINVVHTAPMQIGYLKRRPGRDVARRTEEQEALNSDIAAMADLVVGVGPVLACEARHSLSDPNHPPVLELRPGLDPTPYYEPEARRPSSVVQVMVAGRLDDETKNVTLAIQAVGLAADRLGIDIRLLLRGLREGEGQDFLDEAATLYDSPRFTIAPLNYGSEAVVARDRRRSSLFLLPSKSEGFGLAALEAIADAIPVLVSEGSGIGEMLSSPALRRGDRVISTHGDRAVELWADAIVSSLRNLDASFHDAASLASDYHATYTWDNAISSIIASCHEVWRARTSLL